MAKIAIVIGHNERAQGAVRTTDGVSEYVWNGWLAEMIQSHDPDNIKIFRRKSGGGYAKEIDRVYAQVDEWGADVSVELHFNGSASPSASGCETLSSGTDGSMKLAHEIQARMTKIMPGKNRGVKVRKRSDRGGRSLWQGKAPAVLVEPYFGSNAASCIAADEAKDQLAEAIFRGTRAAMGLKQPPAVAPESTPAAPTPTESKPNPLAALFAALLALIGGKK